MKKLSILFAALLLTAAGYAQKLPAIAKPHHYILQFEPNFTNDTFHGEETIHGDALIPTDKIVLNALEIEFQKVTVQPLGSKAGQKSGPVLEAKVALDPKMEMATLQLPQQIPVGPIEIKISYKGILNGDLRGFYLSKAKGRKYAVTQMEPTDARRAFPSFDEPAYKAPFSISVIAPKQDMAISNGSIASDVPGPGADQHTIAFTQTPTMSTYLVALMVGEFKCISDSQDGVPIRVCAIPEKIELTHAALQDAKDILKFYNQYYAIKYPFKKLDIIAFPDFSAGAMENTAAITYRETLLLIDDKTVSSELRSDVHEVLAHEMAHQWFGDLVTMKWWNDIWLNEGFATWMEYKPGKAQHPDWNLQLAEVQGTGSTMAVDSVASTRPIRTDATTTAEIQELFDGIAYGKTAAVLRMVESYLGEQPFRAGVNKYLGAHTYNNATAEDFWTALAVASKKPVDKVMQSFVTQAGVPMVSVDAKCVGGNTKVTLAQQRFFYNRDQLNAGSKELWQLPVCYKRADGKQACEMLSTRKQSFVIAGCQQGPNFNANGSGYYRVAYDADSLRELTARVDKLNAAERVSLMDNQWAMMRSDRNTAGQFLALLDAVHAIPERSVTQRLSDRLIYIHDNIVSDQEKPQFEAWVRGMLRPQLDAVGWETKPGDSGEARRNRANLIQALGYAGNDPDVIALANKKVHEGLQDFTIFDPESRATMIRLAAKHGDAALYDAYVEAAKKAKTPEAFYAWTNARTKFEKPELVKRSLDYAMSSEVRNQDFSGLLINVMVPQANQKQGWEFVKGNWSSIQSKLANYSPGSVYDVGYGFCEAGLRDDFQKFFTEHKIEGAERSLRLELENINDCVGFRSQQEQNIADWLQTQKVTASK